MQIKNPRLVRTQFGMVAAVAIASICLLGAASAIRAQSAPAVVTAKLVLSTDAVHAASTARMAVVATVAPGYHINDHHPTLDYLIPTDLSLDPGKVFSAASVSYPAGTMKKFIFAQNGLSVYQGEIVIGAAIKVAKGVTPGDYPLRGKLQYQACNDHACLPPSSAPVNLTVRVVGQHVPLRHVHAAVFNRIATK